MLEGLEFRISDSRFRVQGLGLHCCLKNMGFLPLRRVTTTKL